MFDKILKYDDKLLASASDEYGTEIVSLYEIRFDYWSLFNTRRFFLVKHNLMDCDDRCWDRFHNDLRSAMKDFGTEAVKSYRSRDGKVERVYGKVEYCKDWWSYRDELIPDEPGYSGKDYGPSNPWDAPGMKISDFLPGVY